MDSGKVMIVAIWLQNKKNWYDVYKCFLNKTAPDEFFKDEANRYIQNYGEKNILTPLDAEYTDLGLHKLKHPPFVVNVELCK